MAKKKEFDRVRPHLQEGDYFLDLDSGELYGKFNGRIHRQVMSWEPVESKKYYSKNSKK